MSKIITDSGIILKRINYGEADKILTVLTRNNGKRALIAKGVRKITSKRKGHLELFTHTQLSFTSSEGMGIITEAEAVDVFWESRTWDPMAHLYHVCEIVDKLLPEHDEHEYVFKLLLRAIEVLSCEPSRDVREDIARKFEISLLKALGYWNEQTTRIDHLSPDEKRLFNRSIIEQIAERELKSSIVFGY